VDFQEILQKVLSLVTVYGVKIIGAIVIFIVGKWIAKTLGKFFERMMERANVDKTLSSFVKHLTYYSLLTLVVIAALSNLGIQTASFIAVLGAAGLAVGFALQGSLSNFAAGVLIILFKPFQVDDVIEAGGDSGIVEEIQIFKTIMRSFDNKKIILPNSKVMGDRIINYTAKDTRRVDMVFGISYDDDIKKAKEVLQEIVSSDERILKDPAPAIFVKELGDNSVNLGVRPHVKTPDYWNVYWDLTERVKLRFDEEDISFPFPQRDVHLFQEGNGAEA